MPRPRQNAKQKLRAMDKEQIKHRVSSAAQGARTDMHAGGSDAVGTGSAAMGRVKMESEEARMETCFECGYAGGRHASLCSRRA